MSIKIIITGGIIDDLDYQKIEDAPKEHKSYIPDLIKQMKINLDYQIDDLMAIDSKFITDQERKIIAKRCLGCQEDRIIITHGTATMSTTAKYLGQKKIPKTIVLTGAVIPVNKKGSDGPLNLRAALSVVQTLPPGVYIAMNGSIFNWDNVSKNLKTGFFEKEN